MKHPLCWLITLLGSGLCGSPCHAQKDPLFAKKPVFGTLSDRWELDSATRRGTFLITPYKPLYVTAGRWSSDPNEQPVSENPTYNYPFYIPLGRYEARWQLSLKVKALQGIFGKHGDLWVGYTQKSHWQVYNTTFSRPFRETNYEPEAILNFATNFPLLGLRTRMVGIALNHQSNGRAVPLSRSWNRVILHAGFERGRWTVLLRPWLRLPDAEDENPAITDNIGRADATVIYHTDRHMFSVVGSHSLRGGTRNRGQVQFDWTFPVTGNLRGDLQILHGYGETLIDYNHRQTTIGLAVSLVNWL
ncbi:phospholipase A1 [Fibrella aestuarina BUZ 2]|uniref:Phosphatidylcholine 1-acylhydrolase n=1 Tax=Fibrella aestuarina BUZ 2 TaxID=1166018 RepID=I0K9L6_9BACT|nr:phospholipase A [Fibrella aestuarina]CCH00819.1 phospholipase A1 [Fibrella aestuarina BUZ 2]